MTNTTNLFEAATREQYRFNFRGLISVEDLWTLSVEDLDSIFKALNSQLKQVQEESLLSTKSKKDKELDTKIELVKYIFSVKLEEQNARLKAKEQKEEKQRIMEILKDKEDEDLKSKTAEELRAMLEERE